MNTVIVYDKNDNDWSYIPPPNHIIAINYRDDGSLQVFAYTEMGPDLVLGEWSSGSWSHALMKGEVITDEQAEDGATD